MKRARVRLNTSSTPKSRHLPFRQTTFITLLLSLVTRARSHGGSLCSQIQHVIPLSHSSLFGGVQSLTLVTLMMSVGSCFMNKRINHQRTLSSEYGQCFPVV